MTAAPTFLRFLATRGVIPAGIEGAVPTIQRMSLVSRSAISVRTSATPALHWAVVRLVALLGELLRGVGDDFGLVAVDAVRCR